MSGFNWQGFVAFVAVFATLATVPISFLLLMAYRRAVRRHMLRHGTPGPAVELPALLPASRVAGTPVDGQALYAFARRSTWRRAGVYLAAGAVQAVIMTVLYVAINLAPSEGVRLSERIVLLIGLIFLWPLAPTLARVAFSSVRARVWVPLGFLGLILLVSWSRWADVLALFLLIMGLPALFVSGIANRRLTVVGPLVLLGTSLVATGALAIAPALLLAVGTLRVTGAALYALAIPLVAVPAALVWLLWSWLARSYREKRVSDETLMLDAWWLLFTLWESVLLLTTEGGLLAALGVAGYGGFLVVRRSGLRRLRGSARGRVPVRLLLLRTFGSRARSERLMEGLERYWRSVGSIQLIAGTDLATRTMEPHQFLDFVTGRLRRHFVADPAALERRLATLDLEPDPDGRYRINQLFCHDDMWRPAVRSLASESEVVMMDLRGFGPGNEGCAYELRELATLVPGERVVLLCDESTDLPLVDAILAESWPAEAGAPRVLRLGGRTEADVRVVLRALSEAAAAPPRLAAVY